MFEQVDQFIIGWRKGERPQVVAMDPSHLLSEHGARISDQFAFDEMQFNDALRISVLGAENLTPGVHGGIEFLADFPLETCGERLPRIALSTGKLPVTFEMHATLPPGDEKAVAPPDDRGGDEDARRVT